MPASGHKALGFGLVCALALGGLPRALATPPAKPAPHGDANSGAPDIVSADARARLSRYFEALAQQRLVSGQTARVEELRSLLAQAEALGLAGRHEDASLILFEVLLHPRFADYSELPELDAARYQLGSALHELGAELSARRVLIELLRRGSESGYFGPGFRKYVDVALASPDQPALVEELRGLGQPLPEDAQNELRYLSGQERHAAGDDAAARGELSAIGARSRFHANAQYLLSEIATREQKLREAEEHLCRVAAPADDRGFSLFADARYFQVKDLARLGLGRVAHEMRRGDDAFYYYFQVPQDSPRLPEAMFEAAYARYESRDYDTAIDLLDQLEARFPGSAHADEAALLRGYVALSRCDYERARQAFDRFLRRFEPVSARLSRILANPVRRQALYLDLLRAGAAPEDGSPDASARDAVHTSLLALLKVDPEFHRLHQQVKALDAEAARAGRLADAYDVISVRLAGSDRPRAAAPDAASSSQVLAALKLELRDARIALRALTAQVDTMQKLGMKPKDLGGVETDAAVLAKRLNRLERKIDEARFAELPEPIASAALSREAVDVKSLLADDVRRARSFERRVAELRPRLVRAANERALAALETLGERLGSFVRRARIGRIDAVMGSKRRIEHQIESLAAGRFPAELQDPLRIQGFLRDDEEYWPHEGDDWPDEYLERYGDEGEPEAKP